MIIEIVINVDREINEINEFLYKGNFESLI